MAFQNAKIYLKEPGREGKKGGRRMGSGKGGFGGQPAAPGRMHARSPARFRAPKAMLLSEQPKHWSSCLYSQCSQLKFNPWQGDQARGQEEARPLRGCPACRDRGGGGGTIVPLASTVLWGNCPYPQAFSCAHSERGANMNLPTPQGGKKHQGSRSRAAGKRLDAVSNHGRERTACQIKNMK